MYMFTDHCQSDALCGHHSSVSSDYVIYFDWLTSWVLNHISRMNKTLISTLKYSLFLIIFFGSHFSLVILPLIPVINILRVKELMN